MQNLTKKFFSPLFDEMELGENNFCKKCNASYKTPLLPWIVGEEYETSEYKLMIVGKPHRGEAEKVSKYSFAMNKHIDWLINDCNWAYFSYSREIAQQLYGSKGINKIALTNVVKCTNTEGKDKTSEEMLDCCIRKNGVIWQEIKRLKPYNIVFYTYKLCKNYLQELPFQIELIKEEEKSLFCGRKKIKCWEKIIIDRMGKSESFSNISSRKNEKKRLCATY